MRLNHSDQRRQRAMRSLIRGLCVLILAAGVLYTAGWFINRERIRRASEHYSSLYEPAATSSPESTASPVPTISPAPTPTPVPTEHPTAQPLPQVLDVPLSTPDADTAVYSLPTPPPVQESFAALLKVNPETVGFLRIGKSLALPIAQRENDNDFYLTHAFSGEKSAEGSLFLDGLNRLVPEDDCLIVYGHNMQNGTMFGNLRSFLNLEYFRSHGTIQFDTIYENRIYVPFAALNASMEPNDRNSLDIRRFVMTESEFDDFVSLLRARSEFDVPVDVVYGDRLLLLVTCDYANPDGRFILALRELRPNETADATAAKVQQAQ